MPEPTAQALGASEPSITCFKVCHQHSAPNRMRWAGPPTDWLYLLYRLFWSGSVDLLETAFWVLKGGLT